MAAIPFVLSWLLKEVPLRTTLGTPPEGAPETAAAPAVTDQRTDGTPSEPPTSAVSR